MPNLKQNSTSVLIFPENTSSLVAVILDKYNLGETNKEIIEKWKKGTKSRREIIAEILVKVAESDLSELELAVFIEEELKIPFKTAEKIAKELNMDILRYVSKVSEKISPKEELKVTPEIEKPKAPDIYREPTE